MIRRLILIVLILLNSTAFAQHTLETCQRLAREHYPIAQQRGLIEQSLQYNLDNANRGYLPQASLSMRATIQSDVTSVPIPTLKSLSHDQYLALAEITQTIWDGGAIGATKSTEKGNADLQQKQLESDLYTLNERVNSLFFGILLLDEQLSLNRLFDDELQRNYNLVESYIASGVATSVDLDAVSVEILTNRQRRAELISNQQAYKNMLSALIGETVNAIERPPLSIDAATNNAITNETLDPQHYSTFNNRPELAVFDSQVALTELRRKTITSRNMPKLGVFVQGAYGNPGLDMLKAGFTPYAIGGVRLSWNFGGYYTQKGDFAKLKTEKMSIESKRQTFLLNSRLSTIQTNAEVQKYNKQIADDDRIIALRGNLKRASQVKAMEGVMSVTDMLREVTAENSAMQAKALHSIERLYSIYKLKNINNR